MNTAYLVFSAGVFFIGGLCQQNPSYLRQVEFYNPATSTWTIDSHLNAARYGSTATIFDKNIYVMGGHNNVPLNTVEVRCPKSKVWTTLTPMKFPRYYFKACVIDEKIYAVGGNDRIEEYNPDKNEWKDFGDLGGITIEVLASVPIDI